METRTLVIHHHHAPGQLRAGPGILFPLPPLRAGSPPPSDPHSCAQLGGTKGRAGAGGRWGWSTPSSLPAGPRASHQSEHVGADTTSFWNTAAALPLALSSLSLTQKTTNAASVQVSAPRPGAGAPCSAQGPLFPRSVPWLWVASFLLLPRHSVQRETVIFVHMISPWIGCEHFVRDKFCLSHLQVSMVWHSVQSLAKLWWIFSEQIAFVPLCTHSTNICQQWETAFLIKTISNGSVPQQSPEQYLTAFAWPHQKLVNFIIKSV